METPPNYTQYPRGGNSGGFGGGRGYRGAEAGLDLSDIARYVGHKGEATTAGYVRSLGERPKATAAMAASMLDPRSTG